MAEGVQRPNEFGANNPGYTWGATSVRLLTPTGTVVHEFPLKTGVQVLAAAGNRIFVLSQGNELKAIDTNGDVEDLGPLGTYPSGFVPRPDGSYWLWGIAASPGNGSAAFSSEVKEGGQGLPPRTVERFTGDYVLRPYAWTAAGVFIQHAPSGIGGYFPFAVQAAPTDRIDLDHGSVSALPVGDQCSLGDVSPDGMIACFQGFNQAHLKLVASNGKQTDIVLPRPQFNFEGDAWFAPGGGTLVVAGATGVGNGMGNPNPQPEQYSTDLVKQDGSLAPFGPTGARPALNYQSWLADGRLVLWRPSGAAGGATGLYVLDLNGRGPFIPDNGVPVGVLSSP